MMFFLTAGPWNTMSRSRSVSSRKGTLVRTPISRAMSFISDHIRVCHGATAPSSMERLSSGTRVLSSTVRMTPVPSQRLHAPWLLKASSSAPGAKKRSPQTGQVSSRPAATFSEGGTMWPLGQRWLARRENMSRSALSSSVPVPKVERMPGTPGR